MMLVKNIVVLDGFTLNPGDLSWSELETLGVCTIHDRTSPDEIVARARHAEFLLTNKTPLTKETLSQLPLLQYIGVLATGYNVVDIAAAKALNIVVTNIPAYGTHSVAQATFALLLELTNHIGHHANAVHKGRWNTNPDFSFWDVPLTELHGRTFGIIGYGNIGRAVARIASAFGMNVLVSSRSRNNLQSSESGEYIPQPEFTDTETLLRRSDIVSLHCSLNEQNRLFLNADRLQLMKRSAFLINTSRGPLIDEQALANALNEDTLAGAALDVLSGEPPSNDNPLLKAKNCIVTPHIAWATIAARSRLMDVAVNNVRSFINGDAHNIVS